MHATRPRTRARLTAPSLVIVLGLVALIGAVILVGARRERHLQGTNLVRPLVAGAVAIGPGETLCQPGDTVPAGTGALRVRAVAGGAPGPPLALSVEGAGGQPVSGRLAAGWRDGDVEIDVPETRGDRRDALVCLTNAGPAGVTLAGEAFPPESAARIGEAPQPGRASIRYLRPGADSWWTLAPALAGRVAGARAAVPGRAAPYLWALLALGVIAGSLVLVLRVSSRHPRVGVTIALLTTLNALAWGLIVPPFHVPDEPAHAYYAQYLGETGKLPQVSAGLDWYSGDITEALGATGLYYVIGEPAGRPRWNVHVAPATDRVGTANAATASSNPPLYHVAQAAVYRASRGLGVLDRLALMRALSAVMAGLTALCVFGFVREVLPGAPLAWVVGALLAGLQPMFAFVSSGVNNDAGLYLVSAALLLALARLLRRGLTARRAAAAGALLGTGVLVKTQMLAFAPAVGLALALAARRGAGPVGERLRAGGAGLAAAAVPLGIYGLLGATVWKRPLLDRVDVLSAPAPAATRPGQLSYLWQEYLPRLPGMDDMVPGVQPWSLWFKGLVGRFGWLDYGYPGWAYGLALAIVALTTLAAAVHVWRRRDAVRRRAGEIAVYGLAAAGLAVAVAAVSYRARVTTGLPFDQARYLLPLLPLFAVVPALAVRAAGPRLAPVAAALLVLAALGFSVFAQLLTLARYYG